MCEAPVTSVKKPGREPMGELENVMPILYVHLENVPATDYV